MSNSLITQPRICTHVTKVPMSNNIEATVKCISTCAGNNMYCNYHILQAWKQCDYKEEAATTTTKKK
jgi:hypothetical protein